MNETISKFLNKHGFEVDKLEYLDEARVYDDSDVNWIVSKYRVFKSNRIPKEISIADVKGYDYSFRELGRNLFDNMDDFFDENGSGYKTRSISMLDISTERIISELSDSFKREPICLMEADKGSYVIGDNGLHRYHILKAHYIKELNSLDGHNPDEIQGLRKKYTFETKVTGTDFFKTYSNYILKIVTRSDDERGVLRNNYDENGLTENSVFIDEKNKTKTILTDKQLTSLLQKSVVDYLLDKSTSKKEIKQFLDKIENAYDNFKSFRDFYDENLNEIIPKKYIKKIDLKSFEEEKECE